MILENELNSPLILSSPHSGNYYPDFFLNKIDVDIEIYRSIEDMFVNDLIQDLSNNDFTKHISKLSRISLDEEKAKKLETDLNSIFKWIEQLNELKTENVEPLSSVAETKLRLRKDEIKSKNIREEILKNSPDENKDFFVVPKVVE